MRASLLKNVQKTYLELSKNLRSGLPAEGWFRDGAVVPTGRASTHNHATLRCASLFLHLHEPTGHHISNQVSRTVYVGHRQKKEQASAKIRSNCRKIAAHARLLARSLVRS